MKRNRKDRRPRVFLDETWTNLHAAPEKLCVDRDGTGGWRRSSGKGKRLIIVHQGCCQLVFFIIITITINLQKSPLHYHYHYYLNVE